MRRYKFCNFKLYSRFTPVPFKYLPEEISSFFLLASVNLVHFLFSINPQVNLTEKIKFGINKFSVGKIGIYLMDPWSEKYLTQFRLASGLPKIVWGAPPPLSFHIVIQIYNIWHTLRKPLGSTLIICKQIYKFSRFQIFIAIKSS